MALVTLQFIQYNNYFNKILKKPENPFYASSYEDYPEKAYITDVAFNPNDGVTTTQVVNKDIDDVGDYLLVLDSGDNVISHWFIIEAIRNRVGQCVVRLQRDLLVDYYNQIKTAPAFIERGVLSNDDPMIFNDEGLSFNQIKTQVKPLIKNDCAWIVGYMKRPNDESTGLIVDGGTITAGVSSSSTVAKYEFASWDDVPLDLRQLIISGKTYNQVNSLKLYINNIGFIFKSSDSGCYPVNYISCLKSSQDFKYNYEYGTGVVPTASGNINQFKSVRSNLKSYNLLKRDGLTEKGTLLGIAQNVIKDSLDDQQIYSDFDFNNNTVLSEIESYDGVIIKVDNTYYKLEKTTSDEINNDDLSAHVSLLNKFRTQFFSRLGSGTVYDYHFYNSSNQEVTNFNNLDVSLEYNISKVGLEANEFIADATLAFPAFAQRQKTLDESFDIFAIPYPLNDFGYNGKCKMWNSNQSTSYDIYQKVSLAIARQLSIELSSNLMDIQLLPYCPINLDVGYLNRTVVPSDTGFGCKYIKVNNVVRSFILFCESSKCEKIIYNVYEDFPIRENKKEQANLDKYRLVGGNYASMFDFVPSKSEITYNSKFNIYCSFKPYKPFIKINPFIGGFYGQESFKDTTGLILSGDMSIDIISNAWNDYAIQNKNFEAMFDRQIQSLDKNNQVAITNSVFGALSGTASGAATGAIAGGMKGGPYGAIAGAVVGGVASGVGGVVDVNNQAMLVQDAREMQIQMHNFQIDNIKALPNTIQKVSAYTIIDKVVPLLEYYTCTDVEEKYFQNYITYNGMSVGRIDTIQNFESNGGFIQGRFIRLEGLSEDYHLAKSINDTFQAGFYFMEEE